MKKIVSLFIALGFLVGCSFNNRAIIYPDANSENMIINNYTLSPDGSRIVISAREGNYLYDIGLGKEQKIDSLDSEKISDYQWVESNGLWQLKMNKEEKLQIPDEKLISSSSSLEGELYDQRYNPSGNLEFQLISWKNEKILALVDRIRGNFNFLGNMNGTNSIYVCSISKNGAIIKVSYDTFSTYMIYFKNIGSLAELEKKDVRGFIDFLAKYLGKSYSDEMKKIYERNINLGDFEIIDLSYKNNMVVFVDNYTKKLRIFDMKNKEIIPFYITGILNAVSINEDEVYAVIKTDRKFTLQRINVKKDEYRTIFYTNEFICKLWKYNDKIYMAGVTIKEGKNEYKFYRIIDNGVENLFHMQ